MLRVERREKEKILYRVEGIFSISLFNIKSTRLEIINQTYVDLITFGPFKKLNSLDFNSIPLINSKVGN